jgi:hypothetical protein
MKTYIFFGRTYIIDHKIALNCYSMEYIKIFNGMKIIFSATVLREKEK